MVANSHDRTALIGQLAWQHDMGIDEILLDVPAPDAGLSLSALTLPPGPPSVPAPAIRDIPATADTAPAATPSVGAAPPPESTPKQTPESTPVPISAPPSALADIGSLDGLRGALDTLDGCALRHTASNMIFADGNPGAGLMVIGDVPGRDEDRVGLPLVGADGQLFDRMLASIGLSRADIYIVPLIPWRPPGNRTPTAEEMALLLPFLYRHVQLAAPRTLLLLGGVTAKTILPSGGGILKLRGRWHDIDFGDGTARPTLATLHPAYLSRSPAQKRLAFADLVALAGKLG